MFSSSSSQVTRGFSEEDRVLHSQILTLLKPYMRSATVDFFLYREPNLDKVIPLLEVASGKVIDAVLAIELGINGALLNLVIADEDQTPESFCAMIRKASPDTIDAALARPSNNGATALHIATFEDDLSIFKSLVERASIAGVGAALLRKNNHGFTPLYLIAYYRKDLDALRVLINKVSQKNFDASVMIPAEPTGFVGQQDAIRYHSNELGRTVLDAAARYQSAEWFKILVDKVSSDTLNAIAKRKSYYEFEGTLVHIAAQYQNTSDSFVTMIEKLHPNTLEQVIKEENLTHYSTRSLLYLASQNQSEEHFMRFVGVLARAKDHSPYTFIFLCLYRDTTTFYNFINNLNLSEPELIRYLGKVFNIANDSFPAVLVKHLCAQFNATLMKALRAYSEKIYPILFERYQYALLGATKLFPSNPNLQFFLAECITKKTAINPMELVFLCNYQQQLQLYLLTALPTPPHAQQQRADLLKKHKGMLEEIQQILDWFVPHEGEARPMPRVKLVMAPKGKIYQPLPDALRVLFDSGNVLMKVVQEHNWNKLLQQFENYNYRPNDLRHQHQGTHKYVHNTGEIVTYQPKRNPNKVHTQIKKNSVTLISPELCTPLFGNHDPSRPLVGLILDIDKCKIKAQLLRDRGTFHRKWVGSEQEVLQYKEQMEHIVVLEAQREQFKAAIKDEAFKINELLAKYGRDAIVGVVVATDTSDAYKLAESYQRDLSMLNVNVPIVHYSPEMHLAYVVKSALRPIS